MKPNLMIMAAGMGSRYGGLKQLDAMGPHGEALLDYSIYDALRAGFGCVTFIIRRDFEQVFREQVGSRYENRVEVRYVFQALDDLPGGFGVPEGREKPWGTTQAVWCARDAVREPFAAINADDFYGADAYRQIARFLGGAAALGPGPVPVAMAGFRLGNTLSEHGTVSRAVCRVDDAGRLKHIVECTKIERMPDGSGRQVEADGRETLFTGAEPVSMNFWGFTPEIFPLLEDDLKEFLEAEGGALKSENYIPNSVGRFVDRGQATCAVLATEGTWFGVTYREDKPRVQDAIRELIGAGHYPELLWA
jgi:hypothetical protein